MHRFKEYSTLGSAPQTLEEARARLRQCEETLTNIRHDINHLSDYITAASIGAFMEYYARIRLLWLYEQGIYENYQWVPDLDDNISLCEIEDMPRWAAIKFKHYVGPEASLSGREVYFLLGMDYFKMVDLSSLKKGPKVKWKDVVLKGRAVQHYPSIDQSKVFFKDYAEKKEIFDDYYRKQGKEPPKATHRGAVEKLLDPLFEQALKDLKPRPKFKLVE